MRNWLVGFLLLTTVAVMSFSYLFFSRYGWDHEANPIARWLFSKIGLELAFFVVLPIYFILFYWIIYRYYYKVGKYFISRCFFKALFIFLCLLKTYDVAVWTWLFFIIKAY